MHTGKNCNQKLVYEEVKAALANEGSILEEAIHITVVNRKRNAGLIQIQPLDLKIVNNKNQLKKKNKNNYIMKQQVIQQNSIFNIVVSEIMK